MPILVLADNTWLRDKSPRELQLMHECTWTTTDEFPDTEITGDIEEKGATSFGLSGFRSIGNADHYEW